MSRYRTLITVAVWFVVAPSATRASSTIDGVEHLLGASNVNAISGHGRLTVGVSRDGDLTVLTWPNPSYCDQLGYVTSNALDARDLPRYGASDGAGSFLGLLVETQAGEGQVTWLRDRGTWAINQSYGTQDGPNIETVFESERLGLTVVVVDAVAPPGEDASDVLVRHARITRSSGSPVELAWLLTYANLSPMPPNARIPRFPIADWAMDGRNDFAAVWDASIDGVIHFHPDDRRVHDQLSTLLFPPDADFGPIGEALRGADIDAVALADLVADLDASYSAGTYLAVTTRPAPDQHQVGFDATPFCDDIDAFIGNVQSIAELFPELQFPVDPSIVEGLRCDRSSLPTPDRQGWQYEAQDAWADLADGNLSGAGVAAGEVNVALRTPLTFDLDGGAAAEAAVLIAAGPNAAGAIERVASVTEPNEVVQASAAAL